MDNIAKIFSYSNGVEKRREELYKIGKTLKKEFIGIDHVIDNIIKLIEPWRIMPNAQNRPVIINLWGMTGTGKTSLVRKIASLLNSKLIQVDLGEFGDNRNFSTDFYDKYADIANKECIILLDEIQNCRTIEQNRDLERPSLRGLWSLLSDGIIVPDKRINKEYFQEDIEYAMEEFMLNNGQMKSTSKNKKTKDTEVILFNKKTNINTDDINDDDQDDKTPSWYLSDWTINSIIKLCNKSISFSKQEIEEMLKKDFMNTANMLLKKLEDVDIQPQLNYKKSLIFIAGNLDEIYLMSRNANPDITPDILHEKSKQITVPDVKNALLKRYRPEQVARLGNNHVIYPAFNEENFRDIIKLDIKRIQKNTLEQYDIHLDFDKSVENLIYAEGVFPTQGARPVLSTISTLIESSIPSCLKEIINQYDNNPLTAPINVKMSLDSKEAIAIFELVDYNKILNKEKIFLSIETLRKPIYDDEHVMIAVHEAGHTVCQMIEFGEIPTKVCAFSPNVNNAGYMERKSTDYATKETIESIISVLLGGWAAEKLIFGPDKIGTGASGDIETASSEAASYIQDWGFGELPIIIQRVTEAENSGIEYSEKTDNQIKSIIEKCLEKTESNLKNNKKLLLDIASELLNKSHLIDKDIKNIMKRNNFTLPNKQNITTIFENMVKEHNINWSPIIKS